MEFTKFDRAKNSTSSGGTSSTSSSSSSSISGNTLTDSQLAFLELLMSYCTITSTGSQMSLSIPVIMVRGCTVNNALTANSGVTINSGDLTIETGNILQNSESAEIVAFGAISAVGNIATDGTISSVGNITTSGSITADGDITSNV